MKSSPLIIGLLSVATLACVLPGARGANYVVSIGNYYFNPTNITINVGDSVTWSNTSLTAHDSTEQTNLWASPQLAQRQTFTFTFNKKGYYPYFCLLHVVAHPEQTGAVMVVSSALPPTVAISSPAPDSSFQAPATFAIDATVSDSSGTVTNVQFRVNDTVVGNDTTSPYGATASNLSAGSYTLAAIAADNQGLKTTNSISISVTNAPPSAVAIVNPSLIGGRFVFSFATKAGYTYESQVVASLSTSNNWLTFSTLTGDGSLTSVTNSNATNTSGFYRVLAH